MAAPTAIRMLGGRALTGSAAQKEWAEKIRTSKIDKMTAEHAGMAISMPVAQTAKFWIETRFLLAPDIGKWLVEHKMLTDQLDALRDVWDRSRELHAVEHRITMHKMRIGLMPGRRP